MKLPRLQDSNLRNTQLLILGGLLASAGAAFCGGVITNCTQADLHAALVGGGAVTFACSGTITLTNTLSITQDTSIDASGYQVKISGGNAVRLFTVTNASFGLTGLMLADGYFIGANGTTWATYPPPIYPDPGQDAAGGCILNRGGTLTLLNCTLTNHLAQGGNAGLAPPPYPYGAGGQGLGGAICSLDGQVNLTNCLVVGCNASGGIGGYFQGPPYGGPSGIACGGALYIAGGGLNLQDVTLTDNRSTGGGGVNYSMYFSYGADACGGAVYLTNSSLRAGNSVLCGNTATGGRAVAGINGTISGGGSGGAAYLAGATAGWFNICSFLSNSALTANPGYAGNGAPAVGGAVWNGGELRVFNSTFSDNNAIPYGGKFGSRLAQGGAVYSTNVAVIAGCTFDSNLAVGAGGYDGGPGWQAPGGPGEGGAIWNSGSLAVTNSTCSGNQALGGISPLSGFGAFPDGPASGGAVCNTGGDATLVNVTFASNYVGEDPGARSWTPGLTQGGNIMNTNGTVLARDSIFAYGTRTVTNAFGQLMTSGSNVWGVVADGGYNLCSDPTGGFTNTGSLMNTDPMLAPLANYGGPTLTMWLLPGSPARDRIPSGFPPTDQRGAPRPQGPAADMGAVEADNPPAAPFTLAASCSGGNLTLSCMADDWRAYRLLRSTDLVTWSAIATNSSVGCKTVQFTQPPASPRAFYRVVTP